MISIIQERLQQAYGKGEKVITLTLEEAERLAVELQSRKAVAKLRTTKHDDSNDRSDE